jgi:CPA1 family monovalent cation:H+ antiporter
MLALAGCALGIVVFFGQNLPMTGLLGDFVVALRGFEISPEALLYIFLPTLLFEAALMIDVRRLMDDVAPILLLAVVAVVVCTLVVGFALSAFAQVGLIACLLLGAIVATTDPVAVVGIFRDLGAPRRLSILVEGESLFNDAAAIALSALLTAMLLGTRNADAVGTTTRLPQEFRRRRHRRLRRRARRLRPLSLPARPALRRDHADGGAGLSRLCRGRALPACLRRRRRGARGAGHGLARPHPRDADDLGQPGGHVGAARLLGQLAHLLLAAMLVPRLLTDATWNDALLLAILVPATLVARAIVLYGLLPLLSISRMAARLSNPYKLVILWAGCAAPSRSPWPWR